MTAKPPFCNERWFNDCTSPECDCRAIDRAKEIALERGHKDVDHLISCNNGQKRPVWHFYLYKAFPEVAEPGDEP